jgi:glycosyltransferase involved in cell wall biosynthesis
MKILIVLTYYRPHISGLTIYAERLAKAFVQRGHQVTILTSQFEKQLPLEEDQEGVRIVRVPVAFRLSKGVIMPSFGRIANKLVREHDVIQLHLPQFDAAGIAFRGRLLKKPTIITYHCDLELPPGFFNRVANLAVLMMNDLAAWFTHRIVSYTEDYAAHSHYTRHFLRKVRVIQPPVVMPEVPKNIKDTIRKRMNPGMQSPVVGMLARFASEKGVDVLLDAIPAVIKKFPNALFLFAGPYQNIIGEEEYFKRLEKRIEGFQNTGNWVFLGPLTPVEANAYLSGLDLLVVPSLNSTESFGLVQIEAMMNGVRCITSNLPGVRQPVLMHGMGSIFEIGDARGLAAKIIENLENKHPHISGDDEFSGYSPLRVADAYIKLFQEIKADFA